jgi:hypothetical protein
VIEGTATVSADGQTVRTDPGTGVTHPGWHGLTPPGGPNDPPCDPKAPHDLNVDPVVVTSGLHDYLLTKDEDAFTLSLGNAANKQVAGEDPCSPANIRATPLIITFGKAGPVSEFLDDATLPSLMLLPGQQRNVVIKMKKLLTPERISKATANALYGASLHIVGYRNGSSTLFLDKTIYVYRLFDIADNNHTDGIIDFEKTFRDGPGGVSKTRDLILNMPVTVVPTFKVQDDPATATEDERSDFSVQTKAGSQVAMIFDPVLHGVTGGQRETPIKADVQVVSPNNQIAGIISLRGLGLSPQVILFPKSGFQSALATLIDQNPLPANVRGFANLFPPDGPDAGTLLSDESGFRPQADFIYSEVANKIPLAFLALSQPVGANISPLIVLDATGPQGQLIFSTFYNPSLPGGTTSCGASALACATWADFYNSVLPSVSQSGLSAPQRRWLFDSLVNRSYSDPNSAIRSSGSQAVTLYLDAMAANQNNLAEFIPEVSNGLVHEIGHNLGAIHLRDRFRDYIWGDHDVMGKGDPNRTVLQQYHTFAR